ncbi:MULTISPECIES: DsbC family protein [Ectothiorhodospira]|uniref:DsbC family protein n=1 Tax=Ectothiorhodospira TaxID=1051 RepID=UPI001EE97229|nr:MULTISPECIES: DsbC family protein [Ectothiorhodospira]MCG5495284.1 DsbC family protein [Ectothiorhodospira variabilis]MCG5497475.1 DsbC family protein [Ectothiorhodospira variabilis]MCG5504882.1 DsbC family protein [Ectothiorhodospira variabilis]MCG5508039.1 DsbC family protein [Ectothiorhodospira variabilis]MCG5524102.1 DsbC family protein [Ectothiorhodospira haloalkaliphila]
MPSYRIVLVMILLLALPGLSHADAPGELRERIEALVPNAQVSSIRETPIQDLYEVRFGAQVLYMSGDGRYVLEGDLVELDTRRSLTAAARSEGRQEILGGLSETSMVIYPAEGESRHTITVFTDVDCPYCRRLHDEVAKLNEDGITVRYLMFPRSGEGTPTYEKMVSIWCSDDRAEAMDQVKAGRSISENPCDTPVRDHLRAGQMMGVNGTPAILLETGDMIPGYRPAGEIAQMIDHVSGGR